MKLDKNKIVTYLMAKQQLTRQQKSAREQEWHHLSNFREGAEKKHKQFGWSGWQRAGGAG